MAYLRALTEEIISCERIMVHDPHGDLVLLMIACGRRVDQELERLVPRWITSLACTTRI